MFVILIEAQKEEVRVESHETLSHGEEIIECEGCYSLVKERDLKGGEACPFCTLVIA